MICNETVTSSQPILPDNNLLADFLQQRRNVMKYLQSRPTRRKIEVQAIAIIFISSGIWYLWLFFSPFFGFSDDKSINPVYLIYTSFLLTAGVNLFRLRRSGRDLTLALLSIRAITNVLILALLLVQKSENQPVSVTIVIMVIWLFVALLLIAFLMQKETGGVFSVEDSSNITQSNVLS